MVRFTKVHEVHQGSRRKTAWICGNVNLVNPVNLFQHQRVRTRACVPVSIQKRFTRFIRFTKAHGYGQKSGEPWISRFTKVHQGSRHSITGTSPNFTFERMYQYGVHLLIHQSS